MTKTLLYKCSVLLYVALQCVLPGYHVYAQTLVSAKPETVGMSEARLARIDNVIQSFVDQDQLPGATILIARNGKIAYHKSFGYSDVENKTPMRSDAIFRIASQTKAITSAAVLMLYEEGKFLLDDPVSRYIPSFANTQIIDTFNLEDTTYTTKAAKRGISIRDLLTHTAGIGYAVIGTKEANALYAKHNIPVGLDTPYGSLADAMNALGKLPVFHEPGEKYMYGLNTDVLGYLVEVVSGQSLSDFLTDRLLKPLGMKDTYFYLPESKHSRLTTLYGEDENRKMVKVGDRPNPLSPGNPSTLQNFPTLEGKYYSGGAGLSCTALDYAIFLQMLLNGGKYNGQQILSPTTVRLMTTNQLSDLKDTKNNFSLGFGITTAGQAARTPVSEGSFDWGGAFGSNYWVDPVEGIVGIYMVQKAPNSVGGEVIGKFKAAVYQSVIKSNRENIFED